ncbi:MAG TPA: RNA repair transcriptional activator RtcR family protein [Candidatus Acidoferrum sp.]|nr:RNA repair transcriptional activator RtcR family protein [Candidatus Acidoferrum sp.]
MANSFLRKLFGQRTRSRGALSLSLSSSSDAVHRAELKSPGLEPDAEDVQPATKQNSLFAFVDPKDPFAASEIAGEQLPGPILSIMSAKQFRHLFLFHTPHTRERAVATEKEVSSRYPECQIVVNELPVSDPKDYSSVMGRLGRTVRSLMKLGSSEIEDCYVCVSSGTAEMRAAWFLLAALGVLPAKLLQVGSPARPLFGEANVKEVRMDAGDWLTIRELAMPHEYFRADLAESFTRFGHAPTAAGRGRIPWWVQRRGTKPEEKHKAGEESIGFDNVFVERMRTQYGDALAELLLPHLSKKLRRNKVFTSGFSPTEVQDFAEAVFRRFAAALQREGGTDEPHRFGALANAICNEALLDYYRSFSDEPQLLGKLPAVDLEGPRAQKALRDEASGKELAEDAEELPTAGKEEIDLGDPLVTGSFTFGEPSVVQAREAFAIPGLDDALLELGIYVGSAALRHAAEQAGIAAGSHLPVLLLGETGTGKERFAHLVHRLSPRCHRELVPVNCAAIPASLAESYLLGHLKGAFTGATSDAKGIFEAANESTLFLDEIAELTLEVQAKLLRVIQDGVVQRLGSTVARKVDVRIVAASNRDLRKDVSAGRFREDLYFRLEVVQIKLPALRERRGEIPELALMLFRQINQRRQKPLQLTTRALARLESQPWPGNVRDLLNVLERSVLYSRTDVIDAEDLIITCNPPAKDPFAALPEPSQGFKVEDYLGQVRNQLFLRALEACKGNQTAAAELLGVSKQAVSKFVLGQNDNEH